MKQLLILSGKGGTGKTTVSGALIYFNNIKAFADCDVDAPNLHMITGVKEPLRQADFCGMPKAVIDEAKCVKCGMCEKFCRYRAIENCTVNLFECEGCGLCAEICPANAIIMKEIPTGKLMLYKNGAVFSTAKLNTGSGASGKLVSAVKKQLSEEADAEIAIIDGSPGIGCPVIASVSGAYAVLIVAEPTVSGIHDMKRIIETAGRFGVKCAVCVNKYDVNVEKTQEIEDFCKRNNILKAGRIQYDCTVIKALNEGKSIAAYPESPAAKAIKNIWDNIKTLLN